MGEQAEISLVELLSTDESEAAQSLSTQLAFCLDLVSTGTLLLERNLNSLFLITLLLEMNTFLLEMNTFQ